MEDFSKTNSTSGTGTAFNPIFKSLRLRGNQRVASQDCQISQERSQQTSAFQQADQYGRLSTRANMLGIQVERIKQLNKRILLDSRLEQTGCQNIRKYQQISKYNTDIEKQMKLKINQQAAKLDREIHQLFKNRLIYSKQCNKQIKEEIQDLKQKQQRCFSQVNKQMKIKCQEMKHQANQLKKQTILYKKENALFKQQLFGKLNSIRSKINADIVQEEEKRKSYDQIVQNLLQKSCTKAQQTLRRKLY